MIDVVGRLWQVATLGCPTKTFTMPLKARGEEEFDEHLDWGLNQDLVNHMFSFPQLRNKLDTLW